MKHTDFMSNFTQLALENGGNIKPLIIPSKLTNGTGICNPSVFVEDDKILLNLRHIQYTLYHSELCNYEHQYGPLVYLNPENDITLTTTNYLCELNDDLDIVHYAKVDTSEFDVKPLWEFVGLEDARLIKWNDKYYLSGVRRDLDTIGTGRMELSEIEITDNEVKEISRFRIPAPGDNNSYCEKNWMPILDQPFHYVKWTNGTEVVKVDIENETCETVSLKDWKWAPKDLRGGSQVIPYKDGYLTLNHETDLYKSEAGRKDATYRHKFTYWDKDWNIQSFSEVFSFLDAKIEFACGMAKYKNDYLISFGYQDNAAYILRVPGNVLEGFV
jgi:predicted GH43/DUF377 family glycosyl hydrolase